MTDPHTENDDATGSADGRTPTDDHDARISPSEADPPSRSTDTDAPPPAPERLCRRCSTVTATAGDFCPHCGASYVRRRRLRSLRRRTTVAIVGVLVLLLAAGGGTALVLQHQADRREDRRRAAERSEREAEQREREQRQAARDRADRAAQQAEDGERQLRTLTVRELRKAITKDAQSRFADGDLDDRARRTSCDNTDGDEKDLDATSAGYSCIAITDTTSGGESRGYRFTARVNFEEGSYTWHLGD